MKFRYIIHKPLVIYLFNNPERVSVIGKGRVAIEPLFPTMKNESVCPLAHIKRFPSTNIGLAWNQNICVAPIETYTNEKRNIKVYISLLSAFFIMPRGFHSIIDNLSDISQKRLRETRANGVLSAWFVDIAYIVGGLDFIPKVVHSHSDSCIP